MKLSVIAGWKIHFHPTYPILKKGYYYLAKNCDYYGMAARPLFIRARFGGCFNNFSINVLAVLLPRSLGCCPSKVRLQLYWCVSLTVVSRRHFRVISRSFSCGNSRFPGLTNLMAMVNECMLANLWSLVQGHKIPTQSVPTVNFFVWNEPGNKNLIGFHLKQIAKIRKEYYCIRSDGTSTSNPSEILVCCSRVTSFCWCHFSSYAVFQLFILSQSFQI